MQGTEVGFFVQFIFVVGNVDEFLFQTEDKTQLSYVQGVSMTV